MLGYPKHRYFMETRILVTRRRCPYCRDMKKVINKINLKLPIDKRIKVIDAWEYEEFGLKNIPILSKLNKDGLNEGYPFLYISGIIIDPSPTREQLKILLERYLKNELLY